LVFEAFIEEHAESLELSNLLGHLREGNLARIVCTSKHVGIYSLLPDAVHPNEHAALHAHCEIFLTNNFGARTMNGEE
jgi:hypothetical protein